MISAGLRQRIGEIVQPILEGTSIELLDIRLLVEKGRRILRLYIDKPGGVNLSDCTMVSREVSVLLDVHNVISQRYTLEVSSPGVNWSLRSVTDFRRNLGRFLKVTVRKPSAGQHILVGELISCGEDHIVLKIKDQEVSIGIDQVIEAKIQPRL